MCSIGANHMGNFNSHLELIHQFFEEKSDDAASSYPPQIPQARPSSRPHGRPRFVLPQFSQFVLCLTPVVVFSQCWPSTGSTNAASSRSVSRGCFRQSQGGIGDGSAHKPLRSRLAASSASERSFVVGVVLVMPSEPLGDES